VRAGSRLWNRRTFPVVTVCLNAVAAGNAWAFGEHWQAMFGLGLAGLLSLNIVRTEAYIREREALAEVLKRAQELGEKLNP